MFVSKELSQRVGMSTELQHVEAVLWDDLTVPGALHELHPLQTEPLTTEQEIFLCHLRKLSPAMYTIALQCVAEVATENPHKNRLSTNLMEATRVFFDRQWEAQIIRPLAVALEFIPDVDIDLFSPVVDMDRLINAYPHSSSFLRDTSGREGVHTTQNAFPLENQPSCYADELFSVQMHMIHVSQKAYLLFLTDVYRNTAFLDPRSCVESWRFLFVVICNVALSNFCLQFLHFSCPCGGVKQMHIPTLVPSCEKLPRS